MHLEHLLDDKSSAELLISNEEVCQVIEAQEGLYKSEVRATGVHCTSVFQNM